MSSRRKAIEESINESNSITEAIAREMSGGLTSRYEQVIQVVSCTDCMLTISPSTVLSINSYSKLNLFIDQEI